MREGDRGGNPTTRDRNRGPHPRWLEGDCATAIGCLHFARLGGRGFLRSRLRIALVSAGTVLAVASAAPPAGPSTAQVRIRIVLENKNFALLAIDHRGVAYGKSQRDYRLYRSRNHGRTWTPIYTFPIRRAFIDSISVLTNDTLIAHVQNTAHITMLYRSADHGRRWRRVFRFPRGYGTLTPHSVTDDGRYVYVGSYNRFREVGAGNHTNWVWRSANDGRTWSVIRRTTTHRHIHFVQVNPYSKDIYVGYGDSDEAAAIERSSDRGRTWQVVCQGHPCRVVDIAFDPSGFAIFGTDQPDGFIYHLNLRDRTLTQVTPIAGASWSAFRLSRSNWLVGIAHEPIPGADPNVQLFASKDGGGSFSQVFTRPSLQPNAYVYCRVQFRFPNGDFPIQINTYGTIIARLVSS
jgi:photosystem II stability/assembly factor-like uncharacterized protein